MPDRKGFLSVLKAYQKQAGLPSASEYAQNLIEMGPMGAGPVVKVAGKTFGALGKNITDAEASEIIKLLKLKSFPGQEVIKKAFDNAKTWPEKKKIVEPIRKVLEEAGVPKEAAWPVSFRFLSETPK